MKKRGWAAKTLIAVVLIAALSGVTALASGVGTTGDPLVSLSYLNDTFMGTILTKVESLIASRNTNLKKELNDQIAEAENRLAAQYGASASSGAADGTYSAATFTVVTLTKGQVLTGATGCELMLRVGSATCVASASPGLVDGTGGTTISGGTALAANHLYMATVDGHGVKATAATVKVLVRGDYTVG